MATGTNKGAEPGVLTIGNVDMSMHYRAYFRITLVLYKWSAGLLWSYAVGDCGATMWRVSSAP